MTTETAPRLRVVTDGGEPHPASSDSASTPAPTAAKPRNKGGRPKGSRNRVTADARELLSGPQGIDALKTFIKFARGQPIFRQLKGGARERIDPSPDQILQAGKALLPALVPMLKATEISGPDGGPQVIVRFDEDDIGLLAGNSPAYRKAHGLDRRGFPKDNVNYDPTSWDRPADTDSDLPVSPSGKALAEGEVVTAVPASPSIPFEPKPRPGQFIAIGKTGAGILYEELCGDGRERWAVMDGYGTVMRRCMSRVDAEYHCQTMVNDRRI